MAAKKMPHIGAQTCANPQITCCYFRAEMRADVSLGEAQKVMPCVHFLPLSSFHRRHCHEPMAFADMPTTVGSMAESCCHAKRHAWTAAARQQLAGQQLASCGCSKPPDTACRHAAALPRCGRLSTLSQRAARLASQLCWQLRSACSAKLGLASAAAAGGGSAGAPSALHPPAALSPPPLPWLPAAHGRHYNPSELCCTKKACRLLNSRRGDAGGWLPACHSLCAASRGGRSNRGCQHKLRAP